MKSQKIVTFDKGVWENPLFINGYIKKAIKMYIAIKDIGIKDAIETY